MNKLIKKSYRARVLVTATGKTDYLYSTLWISKISVQERDTTRTALPCARHVLEITGFDD
ncbi:MAG: hypothetical protein ACJAZP_003614 [Psychromonas sp.]|jgi:hypothetical protein